MEDVQTVDRRAHLVCAACGSPEAHELLGWPRSDLGGPLPETHQCPACGAPVGLEPRGLNWIPVGLVVDQ